MTLTLNGVNLDQRPKWWSFDWSNPSVHGWCNPSNRLELITAVTGVTYIDFQGHAGKLAGGTKATDFYGRARGGTCDTLDSPPRAQGSMATQNFTYLREPPIPGYNYRLLSNGFEIFKGNYASMYWGMAADGENRFAVHIFEGAQPPSPRCAGEPLRYSVPRPVDCHAQR